MNRIVFVLLILSISSSLIVSCAPSTVMPAPTLVSSTVSPTSTSLSHAGAFYSGEYRNLFKEYLGKSNEDIQAKLEAAWNQIFYGSDDSERVYYPVGEDMAYIEDIGNGDVRTEGMSY